MRDYFTTLAGHNRWANRRLFEACAALSDADYRAERGAFFGSLHGTLNHILVADRLWMGRLTDEDPGIPTLDTILHDDLAALKTAREQEDIRIVEFVTGMPDERFRVPLRYRTIKGERCETPTHMVLAHMFNHATHHRGQAHGLLSQVPADPPPLDLIYFLRDPGR